jgi:hypothetical protein
MEPGGGSVPVLSGSDIERFVTDGFVHLPAAFPRETADECRAILWRLTGCDPDDPSTWTRPVVRIEGRGDPPFRAAANADRLHGALDQLVGAGRWYPSGGLGTFPIRFPHPDDPGDDGWHTEGSYQPDGELTYWLSLRSRGRALLMLFLFSDYLCHPFLIHAAQRHRGAVPRFMAQPPVIPVGELDLDRPDGSYSPVERAVLRGLAATG